MLGCDHNIGRCFATRQAVNYNGERHIGFAFSKASGKLTPIRERQFQLFTR
jgi:hypothetical protein